ncbi:hypothetical protein GR138_26250 [Shinella kummerowiae]|jgi:hypothetical protein|uniref:Uncharacterized protein n=1 Tax=Shinella kummerowiae TaxID=417745 RepID=A0A6N8SHZ9_9HYPH|nr:hypothetical protein [Shinella kummerowiae]MXN48705.1 hypothetical protein [Shinella kummerowiae]
MNSHSTKDAYQPHELGSLQAIFNEITIQDWFPRSSEIRESFARYLFVSFPDGNFDPTVHRTVVEEAARSICQARNGLVRIVSEHPCEDTFD